MKTIQTVLLRGLVVSSLIVAVAYPASGITFTPLDDPLGVNGTIPRGIDGTNIVGSYTDASNGEHGFLYEGSTFTTLNSGFSTSTVASGIDGNIIVGEVDEAHGFKYDGSTYTQLDYPGAQFTQAYGISGNKIVGIWQDNSFVPSGFLYDGTHWKTLNDPHALQNVSNGTHATSVSGSTVAGWYGDGVGYHGFTFNGTTYTTFDVPNAKATFPEGISGNSIVGTYNDNANIFHGFLYDGSTFTTIDYPTAVGYTIITGISGDTLVGSYTGADGLRHGFIARVPEPSTMALLGLGALCLAAIGRRQRGVPQN